DGIRDFHVTGVQTCALPISAVADQAAERLVAALGVGDEILTHGLIVQLSQRQPQALLLVLCDDRVALPDARLRVRTEVALTETRSEERRVGKECRCGRAA